MTTPRANSVDALASGSATCLARPLSAGPAGLASVAEASPGCSEIRVVFAVQFAAPRQVSRTNTWRKPLSAVLALPLARADDFAWLGVSATKATNRPDALTEGKSLSGPTTAPFESVELGWLDRA